MKDRVIGIVRNECGRIVNLVMFDMKLKEKYLVKPSKNAEISFGTYPLYNEDLEIIGNRGLVLLNKNKNNIELITCNGLYVDDGIEEAIIAKTDRLNMRFINADIFEDSDGNKSIYIL